MKDAAALEWVAKEGIWWLIYIAATAGAAYGWFFGLFHIHKYSFLAFFVCFPLCAYAMLRIAARKK